MGAVINQNKLTNEYSMKSIYNNPYEPLNT